MWLSISSLLGHKWSYETLDTDLYDIGWSHGFKFVASVDGIEDLLKSYKQADPDVDYVIYSTAREGLRVICTARFQSEEHAMHFMLITPDVL